jgi:mannose-1-phosphate guanylyltransferase/mannose-6-phosphate isomerase
MAGGSGTRLWPLSRAAFPKQFLVLTADNRSLYQQAIARLRALASDGIDVGPPLTVGNEEHRFMVLDQLRELGGDPGRVLPALIRRGTRQSAAEMQNSPTGAAARRGANSFTSTPATSAAP